MLEGQRLDGGPIDLRLPPGQKPATAGTNLPFATLPPVDCTLYDCNSRGCLSQPRPKISCPASPAHAERYRCHAKPLKNSVSRLPTPARKTGNAGGPISPSASGAPSARTIRPMATAGTICRTIMPAAVPIAGAKTACWATPIANAGSALPSPCGTSATRSSKSGCSASPIPRETTART